MRQKSDPTRRGRDTPSFFHTPQLAIEMSNSRRFGDIICPNRQRGHEFPSEAKAVMIHMLHTGKSARYVADQFYTDHKAVLNIAKKFTTSTTLENRPRSGRPPKLSRAERRYILRLIRQDRLISWDALVGSMGGIVSRRTVQRAVSFYYRRKWKALERPKLDKDKAKVRLQ